MQTRKVFDIAPPATRSQERIQEKIAVKKPAPKKGSGWSFLLFILIILGIVYFLVEPSVTVFIKPVINTFASSTNILAAAKPADSLQALALEELVVPKDYSEKFQASETDIKSKAQGTITLYNENSTSPEVFAQGTRFMDDKGNVFITLAKATVPGRKGTTPGSVDISVQAIDYGKEYNIGPSYFSIPKLKSTPYYTKYYGKSSQSMKGGMVGRAKVVSKEDIQKARETLTQKYEQEALDILKNKYPDYYILEKSVSYNIVFSDPSVKEGEIVDDFFYNLKVDIKAFGVLNQEINNLANNFAIINIPESARIVPKSLNFKVNSRHTDLSKKEVNFDLEVACKYYNDFSLDFLREKLINAKTSQVGQIIASDPKAQVESFWVDFKPFYKPRLPKDGSKIEARLKGVD